jgi:YggT family protein
MMMLTSSSSISSTAGVVVVGKRSGSLSTSSSSSRRAVVSVVSASSSSSLSSSGATTTTTMRTRRVFTEEGALCANNDNTLVFLCVREAMERGQKQREEEYDEGEEKGRAILERCGLQSAAAHPVFTLAAATMVDKKMVALITQSVASFIKLYLLLLFVRVLLTWFPNVNWMRQPWTMLRQVTDPYLNLFRNLIPPIMGQIDFTPILGFMVLQFLARVLSTDPSLGRF